MIGILIECNLLILFIIVFRGLFRNFISAKLMYGMWLLVVLRMLSAPLLFGTGKQTVILNLLGTIITWVSNGEYIRFDFSILDIPWYFLILWVVGSVVTLLWEFHVNFKFERYLFENRVSLSENSCPYAVYKVPELSSSCVFKVKGKYGIYIGKGILDNPEVFQIVLNHEICHIKSNDLLWAKVRMVAIALCWFSPLIWIAAVLSKEDCEMSCDEKTIRFMQIEKARYGTILLDSLNKERRITNNLFCHAVMISPSAYGLKLRIKKIIGKPIKIWTQRIVGSAFVLICIFFCFFSTPLLSGLNEEETIRQYIYYSNQDYQEGMKRLCLYDEWDYFFHSEYKVTGDVIAIHKSGNQFAQKKQQETYKVELEQSVDGTKKSQNETIILVKDSEDAGWKIDMRFA